MEQIYTIPINEAFENSAADHSLGCPFCNLHKRFEDDELSLILGASMMEPDVRIKTNELGFCTRHYKKMFSAGKKLPLALILESHLATVSESLTINKLIPAASGKNAAKAFSKLSETCYICERIERNFNHMLDNAVALFMADADFRKKCASQPCFCIEHYGQFLAMAQQKLKGKDFAALYKTVFQVEEKYMKKVQENVSFFVKKFDYRYADEPWGDAKDAVEKAIISLTGEHPEE